MNATNTMALKVPEEGVGEFVKGSGVEARA